jgi:hypothetical protein
MLFGGFDRRVSQADADAVEQHAFRKERNGERARESVSMTTGNLCNRAEFLSPTSSPVALHRYGAPTNNISRRPTKGLWQ